MNWGDIIIVVELSNCTNDNSHVNHVIPQYTEISLNALNKLQCTDAIPRCTGHPQCTGYTLYRVKTSRPQHAEGRYRETLKYFHSSHTIALVKVVDSCRDFFKVPLLKDHQSDLSSLVSI